MIQGGKPLCGSGSFVWFAFVGVVHVHVRLVCVRSCGSSSFVRFVSVCLVCLIDFLFLFVRLVCLLDFFLLVWLWFVCIFYLFELFCLFTFFCLLSFRLFGSCSLVRCTSVRLVYVHSCVRVRVCLVHVRSCGSCLFG